MTDGMGSTSYSYDQFPRLTSEARTSAGLLDTYTLSYIYNLVHNLTDANFDRRYVYDHLGRLSYASAGGSAREDYLPTPYAEYFAYDVWGNTTQRQTFLWETQEFNAWSTYANSKNVDWGYDADGRNTSIGTRSYGYDVWGNATLSTIVLLDQEGFDIALKVGINGSGRIGRMFAALKPC